MTSGDELRSAIAVVDRYLAEHDPGGPAQAAWTTCRGELRRRRSQSERSLPAISSAAQYAAQLAERGETPQVRAIGQSILDALRAVAVAPPEDTR